MHAAPSRLAGRNPGLPTAAPARPSRVPATGPPHAVGLATTAVAITLAAAAYAGAVALVGRRGTARRPRRTAPFAGAPMRAITTSMATAPSPLALVVGRTRTATALDLASVALPAAVAVDRRPGLGSPFVTMPVKAVALEAKATGDDSPEVRRKASVMQEWKRG